MFCRGCVVVQGVSYDDENDQATRIAQHPSFADWPLVVLVDDAADAARSPEQFLWTAFTRMEPAGDLHGRAQRVSRFHVGLEAPVVWDCRMKPWYPEIMECDPETRDLVDRRWGEYGIGD